MKWNLVVLLFTSVISSFIYASKVLPLCFATHDTRNALNALRAYRLLRRGVGSILLLEEKDNDTQSSVALKVSDGLAFALGTPLFKPVVIDLAERWTSDSLRTHLFKEIVHANSNINSISDNSRQNIPNKRVVIQLHHMDSVRDKVILNVFHDAFDKPNRVQRHRGMSVSFENIIFIAVISLDKCSENVRRVGFGLDTDVKVRERMGYDSDEWKTFAMGGNIHKWEAVVAGECLNHDRVDFSPSALTRRIEASVLFDPAEEIEQLSYHYQQGMPCQLNGLETIAKIEMASVGEQHSHYGMMLVGLVGVVVLCFMVSFSGKSSIKLEKQMNIDSKDAKKQIKQRMVTAKNDADPVEDTSDSNQSDDMGKETSSITDSVPQRTVKVTKIRTRTRKGAI
eukprot:CFRG2744T1